MKKLLPIFILILSFSALGQINATTDDGKKVVLKPDGTWEYKNKAEDLKRQQYQTVESTTNKSSDFTDFDELYKFTRDNPEKFEKSEFETVDEYFVRLNKFVNETEFNSKKLKDSSLLIDTSFSYSAENREFLGIPESSGELVMVKAESGLFASFNTDIILIKIKMPPDKARETKPFLAVRAVGFPVGVSGKRLQFLATKLIVFNKQTNEVYAEVEGNRLPGTIRRLP